MSLHILRAQCETGPNFDVLRLSSKDLAFKPDELPIITGAVDVSNPGIPVNEMSGGLYTRQHFKWLNFSDIEGDDINRYHILNERATVTLEATLVATNSASSQSTSQATIPDGAIAINLGSRGWQNDVSALPNGDEWMKLGYYEQGGLGIGWAFDPISYFANTASVPLGIYMMGALLPDISFSRLSSLTGGSVYTNTLSSYPVQIGRDLALITAMCGVDRVAGPQGYWNVYHHNYGAGRADFGRSSGVLFLPAGATSAGITATPQFPMGFPAVTYPSGYRATSDLTTAWPLSCPSYCTSPMDGHTLPGNCLTITPGSFLTSDGLSVLQDPQSSDKPIDKSWTTFWKNATNEVVLSETQRFRIECPLFEAPVGLRYVPMLNSGLYCQVPLLRMATGVYFYIPVATISKSSTGSHPINMVQNLGFSTGVDVPPHIGTFQQFFVVKRVSLTLNIPVVRIASPIQAVKLFNLATYMSSLVYSVPMWTKFVFIPPRTGTDSYVPLCTLGEIAAATANGTMQFTFTARQILKQLRDALQAHAINTTSTWGVTQLIIKKIYVSCTTDIDVSRLYSVQYSLDKFRKSLQGAALIAGGMKMFSRCGPSLSNGAPKNLFVRFTDIVDAAVGEINKDSKLREMIVEQVPYVQRTPGRLRNDYFNGFQEYMFTSSVSIRMPSDYSSLDDGGSIDVGFTPQPVLNMPFSGTSDAAPQGGPLLTTSATATSGASASTLRAYTQGWFNTTNPFAADYNKNFDLNTSSGSDIHPSFDYKMVDFNRRKIEVWIQVMVPLEIYSDDPFKEV